MSSFTMHCPTLLILLFSSLSPVFPSLLHRSVQIFSRLLLHSQLDSILAHHPIRLHPRRTDPSAAQIASNS